MSVEKEEHALRRDALQILHAALGAVDPSAAVRRHVRREGNQLLIEGERFDLERYRHVFVLALGKAAYPMAYALQVLLGRRLDRGVLVTKYGHLAAALDERWTVVEAGHPVPDENSVRGAQALAALAEQAGPEDLILCALSGGGSALATWPVEGLSLSDLQAVTDLLLRAGATIHELNAVRKHLDRIKGGGLARFAYPATVVTLVLSDVVGDDLSVIASGPMAADPSTFQDAWRVLNRYGLLERVPLPVRLHLEAGLHGRIPETPKPGDEIFQRVFHHIIASNRLAARAALEEATRLGYHPLLLSTFVEGEAREVARVIAAIAKEIATTDNQSPARPVSSGAARPRSPCAGAVGVDGTRSWCWQRPSPCRAGRIAWWPPWGPMGSMDRRTRPAPWRTARACTGLTSWAWTRWPICMPTMPTPSSRLWGI